MKAIWYLWRVWKMTPIKCPRSSKCVTLDVWKQLDDAINNVLDGITLADLANKARSQERTLLRADVEIDTAGLILCTLFTVGRFD